MTREAINELKKYTLGRKNTEKVEISVLQLNRVIKALEQEPKTGHWIPVSERLPEINDDVLISLEWGIDIGRYSDGEWHSEWINHYDDGNVLAWMPLPKPYDPQETFKFL
jgi:hypothetical protein